MQIRQNGQAEFVLVALHLPKPMPRQAVPAQMLLLEACSVGNPQGKGYSSNTVHQTPSSPTSIDKTVRLSELCQNLKGVFGRKCVAMSGFGFCCPRSRKPQGDVDFLLGSEPLLVTGSTVVLPSQVLHLLSN